MPKPTTSTTTTTTAPTLAVVVPTRNRAERIVRLLDALARQDLTQTFEVIVVDDASTDDTLRRLRSRPPGDPFTLRVFPSDRQAGPAAARNRGWRAAAPTAERIAFIDDDCVADPGWLEALVAEGLDQVDIAVGRTRPPAEQLPDIGPFSSYLDIGHNRSFSTCNIAYRRAVLEATDGFDEEHFSNLNGEDTDLGLRAVEAGFSDRFVPEALVWHDVAPSLFRAHVQRLRRIEGLPALVARHPEARRNLDAGWFLRSVDKAVLIAWVALLAAVAKPRRAETRLLSLVALGLYVWQFDRSHYRARTPGEYVTSLPLGLVADSWALFLLLRGSARSRTILL